MSSINAEIGKKVVLSANKFKKNNLIFVGWNTKKDGTGISYGDKATVYNLCKENGETVTLYAKWMLEGCDNLEYSDTTDMINSNGNYTVKKSDKWLLSAIVYDSLGNIVDSKSNKTNEKSYVPSTIDVSVSKKGEYYIKYTYCDYVKKSYKSPVYIDGQMVYRLYTKSGDTITEFMKLTVMEYPVKMTLSNGMDNNKTLKANTDTDITLTSSYWIYSCLITEGDIEYSNNTWSENGKPHYKYNIGKLPKGTYEVAVVEYPATEVGEMVYVNGKLTYTGTGVYYPDVQAKSSKKTWNCIISVE
jgi:hypothetical protein